MIKTHIYKLYKSNKNKELDQIINISGIIYNHCIALHKRYYSLYTKSLNTNQLKKHITKLKKQSKYEFWKLVPAQSIQDIAERIDRSYKLFFNNLKRKVKTSPPGFKKVKKYKSFTLKQCNYEILENNKIKIKKQIYKYSKNQDINNGTIKTITIKRDNLGDYYICVVVELKDEPINRIMTGKIAGIDFGMKTFLTISDGSKIEAPMFSQKYSKQIAKLQRKLAKKKKGSNHRKQVKRQLTKVHKRISDSRKDYFFKLGKSLTEKYDYIFLEDLNIKAMMSSGFKGWGKKISDIAFSEFIGILQYQATKNGCVVHKIDKYFPSSKTCFECGFIHKDLTLNDREWQCPSCNSTLQRDLNASKNIAREGVSSLGLDLVSRTQYAKIA
jgi:putative transposase